MKTVEQKGTLVGTLSMAALINAVALTLFVGISTWVLSTYAWPNVVHPMKHMFVDSHLLFYGGTATAFLIGKEFIGMSKSLTLAVNALAFVASLGYLALYVSVSVSALLVCSHGLAVMG